MPESLTRSVLPVRVRPSVASLRIWRSPLGQPPWARPVLLAIAALAGLAYAWGIDGAALEAFYGAAARSMSMSWHNFFFGALDPAGTVSIDKLPGAFWPQAISLRLFGFHIWAIVLPQVLAGVLTILVLYRALRRLAGPVAGIAAAAILAASPVTVALNRGNVADSLLILLLVLAADATAAALVEGRLRSLLLAGVWVGLAFQVKMTVAWLVLPALAAAYLLAAPAGLRTRIGHLALAGAVTLVVSLSWMTVVSLVPAHDRPYVDGTQDNSVFSQTFDYNGIARLRRGNVYAGAGHPAAFLVRLSETNSGPAHRVKPSWHRLLGGLFGRDDGWLLPAALIAAAGVLYERRRAGRRDLLRASVVIWGTSLATLFVFFSASGYPNSYYVAGLIPAVGGLCGTGLAVVWRRCREPPARVWLGTALLASVGYGVYLLDGGSGVPGWLAPVAILLGVLGGLALVVAGRSPGLGEPAGRLLVVFVLAAALLLPGVAAALIVTRGLGPFAAPYQPASASPSRASALQARLRDEQIVAELSSTYATPIPFATDSSILAAPYILASGREILPIGGFQGGGPVPSLSRLRRYISSGELRAFVLPVSSQDPRVLWIQAHCKRSSEAAQGKALVGLYDCGGGSGG